MDMQDSRSVVAAGFDVYPDHILALTHLHIQVKVDCLATDQAKRQRGQKLARLESINDYWVGATQIHPNSDQEIRMDIPLSYLARHHQNGDVHIISSGDRPIFQPHAQVMVGSEKIRHFGLGRQLRTINYIGPANIRLHGRTFRQTRCYGYSVNSPRTEYWKGVGSMAFLIGIFSGLAAWGYGRQQWHGFLIAAAICTFSILIIVLCFWLCWPRQGTQEVELNNTLV